MPMTPNPQTTHPRYPAYRDSGVEWIGEIPSHWEVKRGKHLLKKVSNGTTANQLSIEEAQERETVPVTRIETISDGQINFERVGWVGYSKDLESFRLRKGDLLFSHINSLEMVGKTALYESDRPLFSGMNLLRLVPTDSVDYKWLHYYFQCPISRGYFSSRAKPSINQASLPASAIRNYFILKPPLPEQRTIARFLDEKTTQLDQAITQKQRLIELLQERRQVLIQQAVTQGLDPSVPMRDSGVDWMGEVPAHWEVRRSKFLFTQRKERARKEDIQLSATQAYGVIPHAEYEEKIGRKISIAQLHLDKRKHVEVNDFVISMRSFQGGLERAWTTGCIRSSYVILRPLEEVDPGFYSFVFKSQRYIEALQSSASFIRDGQDLNFNNFAQVDLFVPPLEEQRQISAYLTEQLSKTDKVIEYQQRHIAQLREYRSVLIHEVVTGKIRVK